VIRVLRTMISRYFTANNTKNWINVIKDIETSYNNTYNKSIKMAPNQYKPHMEGDVWRTLYSKSLLSPYIRKPKFKVNQKVRISKFKFLFKKSSVEESFSREVFFVHTVKVSPVLYFGCQAESNVLLYNLIAHPACDIRSTRRK